MEVTKAQMDRETFCQCIGPRNCYAKRSDSVQRALHPLLINEVHGQTELAAASSFQRTCKLIFPIGSIARHFSYLARNYVGSRSPRAGSRVRHEQKVSFVIPGTNQSASVYRPYLTQRPLCVKRNSPRDR